MKTGFIYIFIGVIYRIIMIFIFGSWTDPSRGSDFTWFYITDATTLINKTGAYLYYPPLCEAFFILIYYITAQNFLIWQWYLILFETGTLILLWWLTRGTKHGLIIYLCYAFSPVFPLLLYHGGIDAFFILIMMSAAYLWSKQYFRHALSVWILLFWFRLFSLPLILYGIIYLIYHARSKIKEILISGGILFLLSLGCMGWLLWFNYSAEDIITITFSRYGISLSSRFTAEVAQDYENSKQIMNIFGYTVPFYMISIVSLLIIVFFIIFNLKTQKELYLKYYIIFISNLPYIRIHYVVLFLPFILLWIGECAADTKSWLITGSAAYYGIGSYFIPFIFYYHFNIQNIPPLLGLPLLSVCYFYFQIITYYLMYVEVKKWVLKNFKRE